MLETWRRERKVRKVLRGLARQHVALVVQPGPVWIVERALMRNEDTEAVLMTCQMRGWIEPLLENMPTGQLTPDGRIPTGPVFTSVETVYRLTEGGWAALNRAHAWALTNTILAAASLITAFLLARG